MIQACFAGTGAFMDCLPLLRRATVARPSADAFGHDPKRSAGLVRPGSVAPLAPGDPGCRLRAPNVHYLTTAFVREVESAGFSRASTVHEVEPAIIRLRGAHRACPRDGGVGCAFVDTLEGSDTVGPASMMLSYTWGYTIGEIVDALAFFCERRGLDPRRTYVWICCLCINQSRVQENLSRGNTVSFDAFSNEFGSRVTGIGHVLALMGTWERPQYITRAWCIYELFVAISTGCKLDIILPPGQVTGFFNSLTQGDGVLFSVWEALGAIDVRNAQASIASDLENILRQVEAGPGLNNLNDTVRSHLKCWFADAAEDAIAELQEKSKECKHACQQVVQGVILVSQMLADLGEGARGKRLAQAWYQRMIQSGCARTPEAASILARVGYACLWQFEAVTARAHLEQAFKIRQATATMETEEGAELQQWRGWLHATHGDLSGALARLQDAHRIASHITINDLRRCCILSKMSLVQLAMGEREAARESMAGFRCLMDPLSAASSLCTAICKTMIAYLFAKFGDLDEAMLWIVEASKTLDNIGASDIQIGAYCYAIMGYIHAERGNLDKAHAYCSCANDIMHGATQKTVLFYHGAMFKTALSYVKFRLGDTSSASELRQEAVVLAKRHPPLMDLASPEYYRAVCGVCVTN